MVTTVLRASAKNFNVKKFLVSSKWKPLKIWHRGEKIPIRKKVAQDSGFNLDIFSSDISYKKVANKNTKKVCDFIRKNKIYLQKLNKLGVGMCVDIGIIEDCFFSLSVGLQDELLKLASKHDIEIIVSFYPNSK